MGSCRKCRTKWTGLRRCHCSGCHKTFNSVGGFDKHRKDFKCLDPLDLKMEMDDKGIWAVPMTEEYKKRLEEVIKRMAAAVTER